MSRKRGTGLLGRLFEQTKANPQPVTGPTCAASGEFPPEIQKALEMALRGRYEEVIFSEEAGITGPRATTIRLAGKHHPLAAPEE